MCNYIAAQLCGGGLMLGAFFMATDYVTSPITPSGKIIYGILLWYPDRIIPPVSVQMQKVYRLRSS